MRTLPTAVREYVDASNAFDGDRLIAVFAEDALVNDARREFRGRDSIRNWLDKEIIGDKVTMDVTDVRAHYDVVIVDAAMDGEFDKTNLPDPLILTHYFTIRDDTIVTLIIIRNER
jgi:ketosteroid isomerase-like protein